MCAVAVSSPRRETSRRFYADIYLLILAGKRGKEEKGISRSEDTSKFGAARRIATSSDL